MTGLLIITALITLMGVLAIYVGVDTRDGRDWQEGQEWWPGGGGGPGGRPPDGPPGRPRGRRRGVDGSSAPAVPRRAGTVREAA